MAAVRLGRRHKYGAKRTSFDGYAFDSKAEAKRYGELKLMKAAGAISQLEVHPMFAVQSDGEQIFMYVADFSYLNEALDLVVEDVKGVRTPLYLLKRSLMWTVHGIRIVEIEA